MMIDAYPGYSDDVDTDIHGGTDDVDDDDDGHNDDDNDNFIYFSVGDSLGMVVLGYDTTLPVTMDE